ncbi:hypothetical protein [Yimella sp. NH-Cas1]|uniref:hypothetical protein n=1 Tax=Yimella sp. NH-Cas1 TaxID=2917726 RepID=UPI001EFAB2C4|nr:hypothetical protein [Yimella sp. NH-Cas1]MCG8655279.1 hypothetical protein [Yimella sp. NH-Cas1]
MDNRILWIIIAAVVVLAIIALVAMMNNKKKKERQREEAAQLRDNAAAQEMQLKEREREADLAAREAGQRREQADRAAAQARKAEQAASAKVNDAQSVRDDYDEKQRQADLLDPDVETDKDGNRLDGSRPGGHDDSDSGMDLRDRDNDGDRFGDHDADRRAADQRDGDGPGWGTGATAGGLGAAGAGGVAYQGRDNDRRDSGMDLRDRDNDGNRLGDHDADPLGDNDGRDSGMDLRDRDNDGDHFGDRDADRIGQTSTMGDVAGDAHHGGYDEQGRTDTHFGDGLAGNSPRGHEGTLRDGDREGGLGGHSYDDGRTLDRGNEPGYQHEGGLDGQHLGQNDRSPRQLDQGGYADESSAGWAQQHDAQQPGYDADQTAGQQNWNDQSRETGGFENRSADFGGQPNQVGAGTAGGSTAVGGYGVGRDDAVRSGDTGNLQDGADWHTSGDQRDVQAGHDGIRDDRVGDGVQDVNRDADGDHKSIGDRIRSLRDDVRGRDGK